MTPKVKCVLCGGQFEDHDQVPGRPRRFCYSCQNRTDDLRGTYTFDLIWRLAERITALEEGKP